MTWNFYLDSAIFFYFCNYYIFKMRRKEFSCFYLYFLILFFLFTAVHGLRLTRHRPSTVWGVQTQFFEPEIEYFNSRGGIYHFRYDTGAGKNQIFRNEKRYSDNTVMGYFGYVDPEGILRVTEYLAGSFGFRQRTILRYPVLNDSN